MKLTPQEKFWMSSFGREYNNRNTVPSPKELDRFYRDTYGLSKSSMNKDFLNGFKINSCLEVGCNAGNQLALLQLQGFANLYGIDIQSDAVEKAKKLKNIHIVKGSAFDLPFKDNYFDLVFTTGVLIHISPRDIKRVMKEIYRVSKKYIWGFEYFSEEYQTIDYRGHKNRLWKGNFSKLYLKNFPDLELVKERFFTYSNNKDKVDVMFLLKKHKPAL